MHNIYMAYDQVVIKKLFKSKTHLQTVCEKMKKIELIDQHMNSTFHM
jgi:hypothetical protein